jgi:transporter family protein
LNIPGWLVYSIICLILWGLWGLILKFAYKSLPWVQVYFLSSLSSFLIALTIFLLYNRESIDLNSRATYTALLAGVFGGSGYIFFVKALEKGEASIVLPLTAVYPAVTVVLALLVLGEKMSVYQAIGVILAMAAVVLLSME